MLAINRGEKRNVLSVKVIVPDHVRQSVIEFVKNHWLKKGVQYSTRTSLVLQSAEDAYSRLCESLLLSFCIGKYCLIDFFCTPLNLYKRSNASYEGQNFFISPLSPSDAIKI